MQGNNNNINTTFLDEELAKLKAIGLKEISKNTKLASSKIEDVLEKRFDKIDRVRAKGFIAILEREYGVDLRDWVTLQQQTQKEDIKSVSQVISKQDEEQRTQKLLDLVEKENKEEEEKKQEQKKYENRVLDLALKTKPTTKSDNESYTWLYVILVLILLAFMGYFAYKAFMQDYQNMPSQATYSSSSKDSHSSSEGDGVYDGMFFDTTKPLEQTESGTQPAQQSLQEEASNKQDMHELQSQDVVQPQVEQDSNQIHEQTSENNHPEQNFFFTSQSTQQNITQQNAENNENNVSTSAQFSNNDNILHIRADNDLWLGIINLETGSKEQFAYKKEYDIKLNHKMLFVMGHSGFTLTLNGKDISHGAKHPVRMYYDGANLNDVGYTRFKQLNGGLEW
ncbi:hypothetical protein OQH61_03020 [Helicobacter sp. MIT 21-1697]|uniref:hypothetical protein n=1 Tax=Helicobacter sp. MIT 21-1697 TaxID=2993733 RepID=UPI00224AFB94|nr:hypothetical protein [Helicobacter sp. MIT 21-1697]MCX2716703.1 hypothetical protein [Helicobacter sp. MIT 21-1697]